MPSSDRSPYFWVPRDLLDHPTFIALSFSAQIVLLCFYSKQQIRKKNGAHRKALDRSGAYEVVNNGALRFTYEEAQGRGIGRATFLRSLRELQSQGFLSLEKRGHGGVGDFSSPSQYRLIDAWKDGRAKKGQGATPPSALKTRTPLTALPPKATADGTD